MGGYGRIPRAPWLAHLPESALCVSSQWKSLSQKQDGWYPSNTKLWLPFGLHIIHPFYVYLYSRVPAYMIMQHAHMHTQSFLYDVILTTTTTTTRLPDHNLVSLVLETGLVIPHQVPGVESNCYVWLWFRVLRQKSSRGSPSFLHTCLCFRILWQSCHACSFLIL